MNWLLKWLEKLTFALFWVLMSLILLGLIGCVIGAMIAPFV